MDFKSIALTTRPSRLLGTSRKHPPRHLDTHLNTSTLQHTTTHDTCSPVAWARARARVRARRALQLHYNSPPAMAASAAYPNITCASAFFQAVSQQNPSVTPRSYGRGAPAVTGAGQIEGDRGRVKRLRGKRLQSPWCVDNGKPTRLS